MLSTVYGQKNILCFQQYMDRRISKTQHLYYAKAYVKCGYPLVPKFASSNPAETVGFFGAKNPQHAFLRRGSKAVCPMSQICGM
jgi:hypothetical protein